jgi:hypothetical protein
MVIGAKFYYLFHNRMKTRIKLADVSTLPTKTETDLPIATRVQRLPLANLTWENFETLCVRLVKKDADAEFAQAYGVRGQEQDGIDLYVRKHSNGRYVVWQCKRYQHFEKSDVAKASRRFLRAFRTKDSGIPIQEADVFILAVTADLSDTKIANEIERQSKRFRRLKIALKVKDIQGLSDDLKLHTDIVADFFHPSWVEEFCGAKQPSSINRDMESAVIQTALRTAQEGLSSYGNFDLDRIRDLWGERREDEALEELEKFKTAQTWPLLNADVRAKAYRIEAGLRLQNGDAASARKLFEDSKRIAPTANARVLEARLLEHEKGGEAVLAFLNQPKSDDEWVYRWNGLLTLGKPKEVIDEFQSLKRSDIPAGDFSAVVALAHLALYDVSAADKAIQSALQKKPRHVTSRYVAAVVDYYSGISPAFQAWRHMIWPVPPGWNLVKRDEASQARRCRAAKTFSELATTVKAAADEFQVWHLACVALCSNDANEPSVVARGYLAENAANVPVLIWASAFGLQFDRSNSIFALKQRMESGQGVLEDVLVLFNLLNDISDFSSHEALLTAHQAMFAKSGKLHLWFLHKALSLAAQGKTSEAIESLKPMPDGEQTDLVRIAVLSLIAERTKRTEDYQTLAKAQEEAFRKDNHSENLLDCCRTHRLLQSWKFIAEHATELVQVVGTQSALEIAAEGLLQSRYPRQCLDLLEGNRGLCQGGDWTPFLRQIAAESHRLMGDLPGAISELEKAAFSEGSFAAKMQLFKTQLEKGDLPAALQIARSLTRLPNLSAEFLLGHVIPLARHHDVEFAKELIREVEAKSPALPPALQLKLMDEASRAGVESTFQNLFAKLTQQAVTGKGPLKTFTHEELRKAIIENQRIGNELWSAYTQGEIPVHVLSVGLGIPLAKLFYHAPRVNLKRQTFARSSAIFTRYAGDKNLTPSSLPTGATEIFLDITSFLLLDALELLPSVEQVFNRIYVGSSLVHCLEMHLDQLSPQQPVRVLAQEDVMMLVGQSRLTPVEPEITELPEESPLRGLITDMGLDWCKILFQIRSQAGVFVDFLPLHSRIDVDKSIILPEPFDKTVVSAQQLLTAMEKAGWVSKSDKNRAVPLIEGPMLDGNQIELRTGQAIHLSKDQAESLAYAGILRQLCEKARVTVGSSEVAQLNLQVLRARENTELKSDIQRLLTHLSSGIDRGKYQVHVASRIEPEMKAPLQPADRALFEAIDFGERGDIAVAVDDRFIRRHHTIGKALLCDTWDILHHLRSGGSFPKEEFHHARLRMRIADIRYLPISADEILPAIQAAPISSGVLQESFELTCLRRYAATILMDSELLQKPRQSPQGERLLFEFELPARLYIELSRVLVAIWSDAETPQKLRTARANWLWNELYFDMRLMQQLAGVRGGMAPSEAVGHSLGHLFGQGIVMPGGTRDGLRGAYFEWLFDYCVSPHLGNDPAIINSIANFLRSTVNKNSREMDEAEAASGIRSPEFVGRMILMGQFLFDLPPAILSALQLSPTELNRYGLTRLNAPLELLEVGLEPSELWPAVARALESGYSAILKPGTRLQMTYEREIGAIKIKRRGNGAREGGNLNVPCLMLLSSQRRERKKALESAGGLFDLGALERQSLFAQLADAEKPVERMGELYKHLEKSAAWFYQCFEGRAKDLHAGKQPLSIGEMLPADVNCLRRHLRLDFKPDSNDEPRWRDATEQLLREEGLEESIVRLSCLPIRLPLSVTERLAGLQREEISSLLSRLSSHLQSPLQRFQFLLIALKFGDDRPRLIAQAKKELAWLFGRNAGIDAMNSLVSLLKWTHLRLGWSSAAQAWSPEARLRVAWVHAGRLHSAFVAGKSAGKDLTAWIVANSQEIAATNISPKTELGWDVSSPSAVSSESLLIFAAADFALQLPEEIITEFELPLLFKNLVAAQETSFPVLFSLWHDTALRSNLLSSYLGDIDHSGLRSLTGDEFLQILTQTSPRLGYERAITLLQEDPQSLGAWSVIFTTTNHATLPEPMAKLVDEVIQRLRLSDVLERDVSGAELLINLASNFVARGRSASVGDALIRELVNIAETCSRRFAGFAPILGSRDDASRMSAALVEGTWECSIIHDDPTATINRFADNLALLLMKWSAIGRTGQMALTGLTRRMPLIYQQGFWRALFSCRAST